MPGDGPESSSSDTPDKSCSIYSLTRGDLRVEYVGSLFGVQKDPRVRHISFHPTLYLHHGRTECAMDFLEEPGPRGDWLVFIDDDMCFTQAAFDALLAACDPSANRLVCGGVYWSPNRGTTDPSSDLFPVVMHRNAGDVGSPFRDTWVHKPYPRKVVANWAIPHTLPLGDAIGTGFMAIHRSVLVAMREAFPGPLHWFAMDTIDGVGTGEDLTFCHRAAQLDITTTAVPMPTADDLIHIKTVRIRRPTLP